MPAAESAATVSPGILCANCGAALQGGYCQACGQRHEPHVHTVGHFAGEAFESISHADSRLWRTLWYLLARPGFLTREFFAGHRASYLPPFRLYLVISVFLFVVAGLPDAVSVETGGPPTPQSIDGLNAAATSLEAELGDAPGAAQAVAALREKAAQQRAALDPPAGTGNALPPPPLSMADTNRVHVGFCEPIQEPGPDAGWGADYLYAFCKKVSTMSGPALLESVVHNIPRAMFVFLPLLALFMKLLYWRPKRYYVEHLLFLVHNHAFAFLTLAILALLTSIPVIGTKLELLQIAIWLYMIWYIFRAMRVYYAQSRSLTFAKYLVIGLAYITTSALVLAGTAIYSALTL